LSHQHTNTQPNTHDIYIYIYIYIYAYLTVDYSADENQNFAQNMDIVNQSSLQTKIKSRFQW